MCGCRSVLPSWRAASCFKPVLHRARADPGQRPRPVKNGLAAPTVTAASMAAGCTASQARMRLRCSAVRAVPAGSCCPLPSTVTKPASRSRSLPVGADQLGQPQAAAIEKLEHGLVPLLAAACLGFELEEPGRLIRIQRVRASRFSGLGRPGRRRRVLLRLATGFEKLEEAP